MCAFDLRELSLLQCDIDASVSISQSCPNLKYLDLSYSKLPPSQIRDIARLNHLSVLMLAECGLHDDDLRAVSRIGMFESLCLEGNRITDRGLADIGRLRNIEHLDLHYTDVDDDVCS